jgi:hypothetical protein
MSVIEVIQQTAHTIEVITEGNYEMVVNTPPPVFLEVQGLFPTTFINPNIDGGQIY